MFTRFHSASRKASRVSSLGCKWLRTAPRYFSSVGVGARSSTAHVSRLPRSSITESFLVSRGKAQYTSLRLSKGHGDRVASYMTDAAPPIIHPIKDDSHPSLFYHLFDNEDDFLTPVFALSFLEERPSSVRSRAVMGWLPAVQSEDAEGEGNALNDFVPNREFLLILHETVKGGLLDDEIWTNGAIQTQSGWMHIFDHRKVPPLGRIPDPDDILASVRVENGRILVDTYEPMPSYRLCTADGVCQLTDTLMDRLKATLQKIAEDGRQDH